MPSGPEAVLDGRLEMRERISFSEHKSSLGQEERGVEGGRGERGGTEVFKQDEKKELRHSALSRLDSARVIERKSGDRRGGFTE